MNMIGGAKNRTPTASREGENFPHIPTFPEELYEVIFEEFKDNTTHVIDDWVIDHFESQNPDFPGNIILIYHSRDNNRECYEIQTKKKDPENDEIALRTIVKIDHRISPPREVLEQDLEVKIKQSSDQTPSDQQP